MFNGIRKVMDVDRLAARVAELEEQNKRLREEASRKLFQTSFHEVKSGLIVKDNLRDFIFERSAEALEPIVSEHLVKCLQAAARSKRPTHGGRDFYVDAAIADHCDMQVEVTLPEQRTSFRVAGFFR